MRDFLIADKFNKQSVEQTILFFFRLYILQLITLTACASNLATFWLPEVWDTASLCQPEIIAILFNSHSLRKFLCNSLIRHILIQLQLTVIPGNFAIDSDDNTTPVCTLIYNSSFQNNSFTRKFTVINIVHSHKYTSTYIANWTYPVVELAWNYGEYNINST